MLIVQRGKIKCLKRKQNVIPVTQSVIKFCNLKNDELHVPSSCERPREQYE